MNWSKEMRRRAADLFEQGYGYKAVSTELGVNRETVRDWSYTWRALGSDVLCSEGDHKHYAPEVKLAAVQDRERGVSMVDVMKRYGIHNRNRIKGWCAIYRNRGAAALGCKSSAVAS